MGIVTIYVLYSIFDRGQISVRKWQLVNKDSFEFATEIAEEVGRTVTLVHNDSTVISDPILELGIVSDTKISKARIPEINQMAINWLIDAGYGQPKGQGNIKWDMEAINLHINR